MHTNKNFTLNNYNVNWFQNEITIIKKETPLTEFLHNLIINQSDLKLIFDQI
jgi:hypothetical protein